MARAIHRNSKRRDETFVQVNCAAIPEELIESELFGHEKGSFTGATEKQIGKFELAHKGTIFLDEIGDMSLRTQAKVLRVLQEGEVERIGSQKTLEVDVRVIAATNKELEKEIERERFREDLFFRLSVIPIRVPPLRERVDDIEPLVEHFIDQFCAENNFKRKTLEAGAMQLLRRHTWRGNVRELRNTLERLVIMIPDTVIREGHVSEVVRPTTGDNPNLVGAAQTLQGLQGNCRARLPGSQAARGAVEHLGDGPGDRHAALQPLQEAGAVRDQPGAGCLTPRREPHYSFPVLQSGLGDRGGGLGPGEESPDSIGQCAG